MAKKGMGLFILLAILGYGILMATASYSLPYGKIIFVDDDFTNDPQNHKWNTIQAAIDDAEDGDIIFVFAGTYEENIFVDKQITLIGENAENVIIDGNSRKYAVNLLADGIKMENFSVRNGVDAGIYIEYDNVEIKNCIITANGLYGLEIASDNVTIINCSFHNMPVAIWMSGSNISIINAIIYDTDWGVMVKNSFTSIFKDGEFYNIENKSMWIESSEEINIENITIHDTFCGIWLLNTTNSSISFCNIRDNKIGVKLQNSSFNEIINCEFTNNFGYGIFSENSYNNVIHHNNFIG
ncbi:MAG: hypothetical protein DRN29_03655, partial [Thermoplasmata archaeon]